MKSLSVNLILLILISNLIIAQVPEFEWVTGPDGTASVGRTCLDADASGNVILAASFSDGSVTFGGTTLTNNTNIDEVCLVKYNSSGEVIWARIAGGGIRYVTDVAYDQNGNIFTTGGGTTVLAKFDASGNFLWARSITGEETSAPTKKIKFDALGNCYIAGEYTGSPTFGDITLEDSEFGMFYIAKYDATGTVLWVRHSNGSGWGRAFAFGVDASGNSIVTGWYEGSINIGPYSMAHTDLQDMFLACYNPNGVLLWAKGINGDGAGGGYGAEFDKDGNCVVTGNFSDTTTFDGITKVAVGGSDGFVAKYKLDGTQLWLRSFGGLSWDHGWDIDIDHQNEIIIVGSFAEQVSFGPTNLSSRETIQSDILVAKLDESGNFIWATRAGSSGADQARRMVIDNDGNCYLTGWINGTADFDTHTLVSSGMKRFLSKLIENYIRVSPASRDVGPSSGTTTFTVEANVTWSVSDNVPWLNATKNGSTINVN